MSPFWSLIPFLLVILPQCSQMQISPPEKGFLQPWSPAPASHGVSRKTAFPSSFLCYLKMLEVPRNRMQNFWLWICAFTSRNWVHCFHPILTVIYKTQRLTNPIVKISYRPFPRNVHFPTSDSLLILFTLPALFCFCQLESYQFFEALLKCYFFHGAFPNVISSSFIYANLFVGTSLGIVIIFFLTSTIYVIVILSSRLWISWGLELLSHFYSLLSIYLILLTLRYHQLCDTSF